VHDVGGAVSAPVSAEVKAVDPVNFAYPFTSGRLSYTQAAAFHAGTAVPADMDHPLASGETVEIYGVGLGVTSPMVDAGVASPVPPARAAQTPVVQIGGRDAQVIFAGLAPGFAGLYQVDVVVPAGLAAGIQSVAWRGPNGNLSYSAVAVK
jgi:adhesin/invasin